MRERAFEIVRRHGWNATAFQTLEDGYSYFFDGDDACVAYVDTGRAWVAAGAPIAAHEALAGVAAAFVESAQLAGRRACFFATEDRLRSAAADALRSLAIGEQPEWDPREWPAVLARRRSLREQLRRARAKGVRVRELNVAELEDTTMREQLARVTERWLATRGMPPMSFLLRVEPFTWVGHRRCFVAEVDGRCVAFAGVIPVPARDGWLVEDLVRDPGAPNGTGELLVDAVMTWAAERACSWITLGLAPLAGRVAGPLRLARRTTGFLYDFEGVRRYKQKLAPDAWSPIYLSFPPTQSAVASVLDSLTAFAGGGLIRFGWRSLMRA